MGVSEGAISPLSLSQPRSDSEMYASNPILSQKQIFNILRSGGQTESIDLRVSIQTTGEQLKELAERLNAAIREKYMKDFYPTLECFVSKVDWEQETMTIELWLDHRSNFQNGRQRWTRSTTFAKLLRHTVAEVGLEGGKMEVINLEGVSDWFAAVMAEQQERVPVAAGRSRQRMLPEGFADPDLLARTHTPDDADDFEGDEEEAERQQRLGE